MLINSLTITAQAMFNLVIRQPSLWRKLIHFYIFHALKYISGLNNLGALYQPIFGGVEI